MQKVVRVVKCALARSLGCVCKYGSISSFLIGDEPGGLVHETKRWGERITQQRPRKEKTPAKKHVSASRYHTTAVNGRPKSIPKQPAPRRSRSLSWPLRLIMATGIYNNELRMDVTLHQRTRSEAAVDQNAN
jgi:hypothetical protein